MLLSLLAQAAALLISSVHVHGLSISPRATTCNGHAELCSRSYGKVTFVGAHDSYAVGASDLASNQDYDVTQQLKDGIRVLQLQVHQQQDGLRLCHTNCLLKNGGLLADYLKKVKTWVTSNPTEVVTIVIVNSDNQPSTQFQSVYQSTGLEALSYAPPKGALTVAEWPTLGEMIDSKKTVVTFLDNQADFATVPYLIDEFTNVWETSFDVTEPTFACGVNRTQGTPASQLYLINHYLDKEVTIAGITAPAPFKAQLNVTNALSGPGSLGAEVETCKTANGRPPNFLLVDFYEYGGGSVFQVAANENGVAYNPSIPIAAPIVNPTATSTPLSGALSLVPVISSPGLIASSFVLCAILGGAWSTI